MSTFFIICFGQDNFITKTFQHEKVDSIVENFPLYVRSEQLFDLENNNCKQVLGKINNSKVIETNVNFFPFADTVFYYGDCCTPSLNIVFKNSSSQLDTILFSTDLQFEFKYSDSLNTFSTTDFCGFEMQKPQNSNKYELWYQPIDTWWDTDDYLISFSTTLYLLGYFNLTLKVFNDDVLIDSVSQLFHSYEYLDIEHSVVSETFHLSQNFPNPFNPSTSILFTVPKKSHVRLQFFDIAGRIIETLVDENKNPGDYTVQWNAENISSGVYFYQIITDDFIDVKKSLLIK